MRRLFFIAWAVLPAVAGCSLISDYAIDRNAQRPPDRDASDDVASVNDAQTQPDSGIQILDAGPDAEPFVCTETPCIVEIAAAEQSTCARTATGDVYCWGNNEFGVTGRATGAEWGTPNKIAFAGPVDGISVGGGGRWSTTACARRGNIIECWGADETKDRKLGRGNITSPGDFVPTPGPVVAVPSAASDIAVGSQRVCALFGTSLSCWGRAYDDQIHTSPTAFAAPKPVKRVYGGRSYHCAVLDSGEVACAGFMLTFKQFFGDAGPIPSTVAMTLIAGYENVAELAAQGSHICGLQTGGGVLCSGRNDKGQLGRGNTSSAMTAPAPVTLPAPGIAKLIGGGANHTCVVLTDDSVWCWGRNDSGNAFDGKATPRGQVGAPPDGGPLDVIASSPRKVTGLPAGRVRQVTGGYEHTCVLMGAGTVYCWGGNRHGQLGLGKSTGSNAGDANAHPNPVKVLF